MSCLILLSLPYFLQCILKNVNVTGGDRIFAGCLFDSGFSLTDPGTIAAHGGDEDYRIFMPS